MKDQKLFNEITIAGRDYKRNDEFYNYQWSTTQHAVETYKDDFYADGNEIKWKSNDRNPFTDMLLDFYEADLITLKQVIKTSEVRETSTKKWWSEYFSKMERNAHTPRLIQESR